MSKFKKTNKFSLDEKIEQSKFDFCKNLKWFLIAPAVIIIVGVILLCTLGFNLGIDFTGGSNMTIYIDSDGIYGESLDIDENSKEIRDKIQSVLDGHGLHISTFQTTTMTVDDLNISEGDAVLIKYQNDESLTTEEIEEVNDQIRLELLKSFGYVGEDVLTIEDLGDVETAVLVQNGGVTKASALAELNMRALIALLVVIVLVLIYAAIRFDFSSGLITILMLFHGILVTTAVVLICRIQINVSFIAGLFVILAYSVSNSIITLNRIKERLKVAENANQKIDNAEIANSSVKETLICSILIGAIVFVMFLMITLIGVADVREFAFPILIGILAGFYSSVCLVPGLWAIVYKPKKRKKSKQKSTEVAEGVEVLDAQD